MSVEVRFRRYDALAVARHVELWWMYLSDNDAEMLHSLGIAP